MPHGDQSTETPIKPSFPETLRSTPRDSSIEATKHLPEFLDEVALASRWGVTIRMLQKWRLQGGHIVFYRLGSAIRYRMSDILEYEKAHEFRSTSEYRP